MTQEEKQLLLKDLCARLPYRTFVQTYHYNTGSFELLMPRLLEAFIKDEGLEIKPYLRPMSSMTDEEKKELLQISHFESDVNYVCYYSICCTEITLIDIADMANFMNWLNEHHFDYRGLIGKGLALEAHEGMYNK